MKPIDILHACSFTGHRPEKLEIEPEFAIDWLNKQIKKAIDDGYTDFITGMQRGVDIWAAEIILKLRSEGKNIKLFCACAWNGMENEWEENWINRYRTILANSYDIIYVSEKPGIDAFLARDHWMVDNSSRLIGVYTGKPGGTKETIWYAKNKNIEVITI